MNLRVIFGSSDMGILIASTVGFSSGVILLIRSDVRCCVMLCICTCQV